MTDIVERLRRYLELNTDDPTIYFAAADEIERLRAELASAQETNRRLAPRVKLDLLRELRAERDALLKRAESAESELLAEALERIAQIRRTETVMAERDALRKDAERYRWMRIRCARKGYNLSFTYAAGGEPTDWKPLSPEECDEAIDAALAKEKA